MFNSGTLLTQFRLHSLLTQGVKTVYARSPYKEDLFDSTECHDLIQHRMHSQLHQ